MVSPCLCLHTSIVGLERICLPKWGQSGYTTGQAREKLSPATVRLRVGFYVVNCPREALNIWI